MFYFCESFFPSFRISVEHRQRTNAQSEKLKSTEEETVTATAKTAAAVSATDEKTGLTTTFSINAD